MILIMLIMLVLNSMWDDFASINVDVNKRHKRLSIINQASAFSLGSLFEEKSKENSRDKILIGKTGLHKTDIVDLLLTLFR